MKFLFYQGQGSLADGDQDEAEVEVDSSKDTAKVDTPKNFHFKTVLSAMNGNNKKMQPEEEGAIEETLLPTPKPNSLSPGDFHQPRNDVENGGSRLSPSLRRRIMAVTAFSEKTNIKKKLSKRIQEPTTSKKLDRISRVIFPLMFALYSIGYFLRYMTNKDYFSENM